MKPSVSRGFSWLLALLLALTTALSPLSQNTARAGLTPVAPSFGQDWTDPSLISVNHDWSAVPGYMGYLGNGLTESPGVDPQTVTAGTATTVSVLANQIDPRLLSAGGVAEFELRDPVVGLQGSGTASAPHLLISLNTSGKTSIHMLYTLRDLDGSGDNAVQPVALQYRLGNSGAFTNIPEAYVADATSGPFQSGMESRVSIMLPVALENQPLVQLRIITTNAAGNDEWVGVDRIHFNDSYYHLPVVNSVTPVNNAFAVPVDSAFTLNFNKPVIIDDLQIELMCDTTWYSTFMVDPFWEYASTIRLIPYQPLPAGVMCTLKIPYTAVADTSGLQPFDDFITNIFTAGCGEPYTHMQWLHDGNLVGPGTPLITEGVVTAFTPNLGGYFLQDPNPVSNYSTSQGIFVVDPGRVVVPGDRIRMYGTLMNYDSPAASYGQHYQQSELVMEHGVEFCDAGNQIQPAALDLPLESGSLEDYEGMLVTIPEALTVQQNYFQGRFGQLTLAADGRVFNPNNGQSGTVEQAVARLIVLDDGSHLQNPDPLPYYTADGALRAGDTVSSLTGVLDQGRINALRSDAPDFSGTFPDVYYRIHPTSEPVFTKASPRPATIEPPEAGGEITVAGFNLHNYFTTLDDTPYPVGSPYDSLNTPRGADSALELERQTAKIVEALAVLDADVVGLVEVESWAGAGAVQALVDALNGRLGTGTYAVVPDPVGFPYPQQPPAPGGDFIRVALIYKPARLSLTGPSLMDNNAVYSRVPVAQTFTSTTDGEVFSVVVNHFKSKSDCPADPSDPNSDHGQGCWNALRVQQAGQLSTFVQSLQSGSGDLDVLVIGDLNAYGAEDPIDTFTDSGLINLVAAHVPTGGQYSTIFNGQSGYLDHALASFSLAAQTVGASFWHTNADEPSHIDYNTEYKAVDFYSASPFRSSDHDPLLVYLELDTPRPSITSDDLPQTLAVDQTVEFHLRAMNPVGSAALTQAVFHYRVGGASLTDIALFEYYDEGSGWLPLSPAQDGPDLIGTFGPDAGFLMPPGYDSTTAFRIRFNRVGIHQVSLTLQDLASDPPLTRAVFSRGIQVGHLIFLPLAGR